MKKLFLMLFLVVTLSACGKASTAKTEGQACETDADCATGTCIDFSKLDDGCSGKACVASCTKNEDCTLKDAGESDCEGISDNKKVCLYENWEKQFCKK